MPLTNTGESLSHGTKRPNLESADNPPTKKAKSSDGRNEQESKDARPSMWKESQLTTEKSKSEVQQETKDSERKEDVVKPKKSESNDQPMTEKLQEGYVMNVNGALVETHQGTPLRNLVNLPVTVLKGISEKQAKVLSADFKVRTVRDLANWKFYVIAKSMQALAEVEEKNGRQDTSLQNVNDALDQEFEKQSITTIMEQKVDVLQGVGKVFQGRMSKKIGITTMKELANFKPAKFAAALIVLADYETAGFESKTTPNDAIPLSTFRPAVG